MQRIVQRPPLFSEFKPVGVRRLSLETVELSIDEFEAIRLTDHMELNHNEAALEMEISRSTFTRLIEHARSKMADFIIKGKNLQINGGNIHFRRNIIKCNSCGHMFNTNFKKQIIKCPSCGSDNIVDLAGGFGHGKCCRNYHRGGEIMPGGDRTGPDGKGPRTGRGLGKSAGNKMGRNRGKSQGRGRGQGQGSGQGRNRR